MFNLSKKSHEKLTQCHIDLQTIFREVIKIHDCIIIEGHRDEEAQNKAFQTLKSKLKWPNSKHNQDPSLAVDVSPHPIDWNDTKRWYFFAGLVLGISERLLKEGKIKHKIRWGGDWKGKFDFKSNSFNDLPHFEIIDD